MEDMYDDPENLHRLADFLSRGVLSLMRETEAAGQFTLLSHYNQAMPYADELPDPACGVAGAPLRSLWCFMAAQEFALVGPAQHEEFLLRYQLPILKQHGLAAYGCCEDLTRKIPMLRKIPNLRRIAVSPFARVAECAEQIGRDYTISYRPNPALLASGYRREAVARQLERDIAALKGCHFDITLKDMETVEGEPERIVRFVADAKATIDRML